MPLLILIWKSNTGEDSAKSRGVGGTGHRAQEHRAQGTSTGHRAQGTGTGAGTRARGTGHGAQSETVLQVVQVVQVVQVSTRDYSEL